MLAERRRVILRQVIRPPYVYRWAGLAVAGALFVGTSTAVLVDPRPPLVLAAPTWASWSALLRGTSEDAGPPPDRGHRFGDARPHVGPGLLSTVESAAPGSRTVALTFDDGPWPESTPAVLDILDRERVPAVFCMIGQQASAHPDLVRRVVAEGHRLCDHTLTHDPTVATRPAPEMDVLLAHSRDTLLAAAGPGATVDWFRAPEGRWTPTLRDAVARAGMRPLGWSVDPLDWTRPGTFAIEHRVAAGAHPGAVVLMHDGGGRREQTESALADVIADLRDAGYTFVFPT
ncbi:hydrolase [Actinomycetospora sp. NBRC 106375]|uniref:polysaccharide deacetylase family protein n=1 Tax=Actinomycetospora sp. NBRC 106375 TaxID=3032207 RepID=UPI0024A1857F|nr:polysaccharide deacetylase family protein [Actinomycetospora sp. NBRC 106375]GLZ48387.1 hydrolase [Actinomycetospora sp. NBRC 106375]